MSKEHRDSRVLTQMLTKAVKGKRSSSTLNILAVPIGKQDEEDGGRGAAWKASIH